MSEEKQLNGDGGCKCNCFKKLVAIIVGSFIGAYLALMLFTAINKPCPCAGKMPPQMFPPPMEAPQNMDNHPGHKPPHMKGGPRPDFRPDQPRPDFRPDQPGPRPEGRPEPRPDVRK